MMRSVFILTLMLSILVGAVAHGQGTVTVTNFYSDVLEFNRDVRVYLPEGYDANPEQV